MFAFKIMWLQVNVKCKSFTHVIPVCRDQICITTVTQCRRSLINIDAFGNSFYSVDCLRSLIKKINRQRANLIRFVFCRLRNTILPVRLTIILLYIQWKIWNRSNFKGIVLCNLSLIEHGIVCSRRRIVIVKEVAENPKTKIF